MGSPRRLAKAKRRRQIMVAASSIGRAHQHGHRGGVAHSNRLPVLLLSGEPSSTACRSRAPAGRAFKQPSISVNDAFRAVTAIGPHRQAGALMASLPRRSRCWTDPAECGPAFIAHAQDFKPSVRLSVEFFEPRVHQVATPRPTSSLVAAASLRNATQPLLIAGAACTYSLRRPSWLPSPNP